jgi:hypothetical protein
MPVTLISSHAACGRADRLPGVAVACRGGAPAGGFSGAAGHGSTEASRRRIGREAQRVRIEARSVFSRERSSVRAGRTGGIAALGALADLVPETQREHSQQGGAPAELVSFFAIERFGVVAGLRQRLVGFLSAGVAVAVAFPVHDIRARLDRRRKQERHGLRRHRPGPGRGPTSPIPAITSSLADPNLDNEIQAIQRALDEHGPTERRELARFVGARYWGPGVFSAALREALEEGDIRRPSRTTFAARESQADHESGVER